MSCFKKNGIKRLFSTIKKTPPGSEYYYKKAFLNGYTFFTNLTVLATKREVPVLKGSDGRIQKVGVFIPILQALPQK